MKRRTFLKTAAGTAATPFLAPESYAANDLAKIQHIVVLMMENRSFDHMLGWLPNADGKQAGLSYPDASGTLHPTYPLAPDWTGCGFQDPSHSYDGGRIEYNNGAMDGWLQVNDNYCLGYYGAPDFPFFSAFARNFTACDRYFASILGPTFPNRIFAHAAQTDRLDNTFSFSILPTIWDRLLDKGVSCQYYYGNLPILALWGLKYLPISSPYAKFLDDCKNGTLPAVSFVDPKLTTVLNFANDDHPHSDMRNGDALMAEVFHAIANSPLWQNTIFVINWDEWGGFFDHVAPPRAAAPNDVDPDVVDGKALLGMRIPSVVASPWNVGNPQNPTVSSWPFDNTSVLKLIELIWKLEPLTARDASHDIGNLLRAIDLRNPPQAAPALPSPRPHGLPDKVCFSSIDPMITAAYAPKTPRPYNDFQAYLESGALEGWPIYE